jgi:hypothetical protein
MTQTAMLTPSDGHNYDSFGSAVAISGNTVVAIGRGKGYVFVEPSGGWADMTQTGWLIVPSGSSFSVSIDGNTVVTGNPGATINSKYSQGAAYLFVKPASGWSNATCGDTRTASDGAAGDSFGYAVAVSGRVATGAPFAAVGSTLRRAPPMPSSSRLPGGRQRRSLTQS